MTIYDAAMAIVVVLGMVRGAWRGFTWQIASIASLVLGYTAGHTVSGRLAPYLPGEPEVQRMLAMGVVYIAVSGGIFGIAWMIRGTLRKLKFEAFDRHLGMLLGGLEGVGVGMLATMFVVSLAPNTRQPIFSSSTGRIVGTVLNNLGPVLPGEVRKVLAPHWDPSSADEAVAAREASADGVGTENPAATSGGVATSSELPALQEAEAAGNPSTSSSKLPALPALAAPAGADRAVRRASASADSGSAPALDGPQGGAGLDGILDQGRQEVEQAVAETLDTDPDQKATSLRQLVNKDKQRIKGTLNNIGKSKQQAGSQVKDRLSKGQQQVGQAISDSISRGQRQVDQAISNSIDQQLHRLGGLESAPREGPK